MQEQNTNPNGQEVKREIPNQHLADRIAGKVDEKGKDITDEKKESVETGVPNQHLSDKIAGKVDHNNNPIEEQLGDVPDELPTHLGGIEMENSVEKVEDENTTATTEPSSEDTSGEKVNEAETSTTSQPEEEKVGSQSESNTDDGSQKG